MNQTNRKLERIFPKFSNFLKNDYFFIIVLVFITLIFAIGFFYNYHHNFVIGGWDGTSHYAMSKHYSDSIFPKPFGWTQNWNAGMPWPLGYPPLFNYTMAVLDRLLPLDFIDIFRWLFTLLTFSFPLLIYSISKKLGYSRSESFVTGLLSIGFLIDSSRVSKYGISMGATFENGLYPQFFSAIMLLIWFYFFLSAESKRRNYFISIILFSLVILSNIHVAQSGLVIIGVFAIIRSIFNKNLAISGKYILYFPISILLIAFWTFPLLYSIQYFLAITFNPIGFFSLGYTWVLIFFSAIGGYFLLYRSPNTLKPASRLDLFKEYKLNLVSILFSAFSILIIALLPFNKIVSSLPLQPGRLVPTSIILFILLVPFVLSEIKKILNTYFISSINKYFIPAVIIFIMIIWFRPADRFLNNPFILADDLDVVKYTKTLNEGRSIFEYYGGRSYPLHFNVSSLVGLTGDHQTIWNLFRESSLNAPFIQPLRNSFSLMGHESFGVTCFLCLDNLNEDFYGQSISNHLERAKLYNVKYLVVRSNLANNEYLGYLSAENGYENENFKLLNQFGDWKVLSIKYDLQPVISLSHEPILVFTDLKTKDRPYQGLNAYDWFRISEEWFSYANFNNILALAKDKYIDTSNDLEKFKLAILFNYKYKNLSQAVEKLDSYTENNILIIFDSGERDNELISRIKNNKNVIFLQKTGNVKNDMEKLLIVLDDLNLEITQPVQVGNINIQQQQVSFSLDDSGSELKKIYVKMSYFPFWRDEFGADVYLASPGQTLVITSGHTVDLQFKAGKILWCGVITSVLTLIGILFAIFKKISPKSITKTH